MACVVGEGANYTGALALPCCRRPCEGTCPHAAIAGIRATQCIDCDVLHRATAGQAFACRVSTPVTLNQRLRC